MASKKNDNDVIIAKLEKEDYGDISVDDNRKNVRKKRSLKFTVRLVISLVLFVVFLSFSIYFLDNSVKEAKEEIVKVSEKSNLDYKVKVKPNRFYEGKYLEKNMSYVASLIDTIYVDFNYNFDADKSLFGEYKYKVVGELVILNSDTNELFFSKKYDLSQDKTMSIYNNKSFSINKIVDIDYDHYNSLANGFKSTYGVNATSKLKVYLEVTRKFDDKKMNVTKLDGTSKLNVDIPLSEKAISIKLDYKDIDNIKNVVTSKPLKSWNFASLALGLMFLSFLILDYLYVVNRLFHFQNKYTTYEMKLRKILREYDRMIVNSGTEPNLRNFDVTEVDSFTELVDAKENLHKPIYYYDVVPSHKSYFYVKADNELIIYTLSDDVE